MFVFGQIPEDPAATLGGVVDPETARSLAGFFLLARSGHHFLTLLETLTAENAMTPAQFRLLMVLGFIHPEGAAMSEVAETLDVQPPSLTELARQTPEWFRRTASKEDRRVVLLNLTSEGREALHRTLPLIAGAAVRIRSRLGSETWQQLITASGLLDKAIDKEEQP